MNEETYYPGYHEEIQLVEYEEVKRKINKKYKTSNTALEIRSEFEVAYNKIFDKMIKDDPNKIIEIIWVIMDVFNIDEVKAIRYLNKDNFEMVRNYMIQEKNTVYYQNIEKDLKDQKIEKKANKYRKSIKTIMDLFE